MANSPNKTLVSSNVRAKRAILAPGHRLGKYRIERLIGKGGMAEVYLAKHDLMQKSVAIKVLLPELAIDEDMVKRFKGEANAAYGLRHPNIIRIHYVDEADGIFYFSMDYIEGRTLSNILAERGKLSEDETLDFARQICRALTEAHDHNLVHRDIKPANIMVTDFGNVIVTDFGIAKDWTKETTITQFGVAVCTPRYASPEQKAARSVDGRSDIYSLGILMFEMATGRIPSQVQDKDADGGDRPLDPRLLEQGLSVSFANLVMKAIEPRAEKRFASAAEMLKVLDSIVEGNTFHYKPALPRAKKMGLVIGAGTVVMAALIAFWLGGGNEWIQGPAPAPGFTQEQVHKARELIQQADLALKQGKVDESEALYMESFRNNPRSKEPLDGLRRVREARKEAQRKEEEARRAKQKEALAKQAAALAAQREADKIKRQKALELENQRRTARSQAEKKAKELYNQGEKAADQNQFAKAQQLWKQALAVYPEYGVARTALDSLPERERLHQRELDLEARRKALVDIKSPPPKPSVAQPKPNPSNTNAVVEQAIRAAEKGNYGLALNMVRMVLTLDPNSELAKKKLAEIKMMQQKNN